MSTPPPPMQASAPIPVSPEPQQPRLSEGERLIDTFIAPRKTFEDIRTNPSWWVPWLLVSVLSIVFWVEVDKKVGFEQVARTMMADNRQFEQQTPEQQQRTLGLIATSTKVGGYAAPVFVLLSALIIALVLWGTFNFTMAAEIPFSRAMAIVLYGWLPGLVGSILAMIAVWFGDPEGFRLDSPIGTNPAHFMDPHSTSKFILGIMSSFDVISFWMIALIGIGFAVNAKKKISSGAAIGAVAAWYFLYRLAASGLAGLRG